MEFHALWASYKDKVCKWKAALMWLTVICLRQIAIFFFSLLLLSLQPFCVFTYHCFQKMKTVVCFQKNDEHVFKRLKNAPSLLLYMWQSSNYYQSKRQNFKISSQNCSVGVTFIDFLLAIFCNPHKWNYL